MPLSLNHRHPALHTEAIAAFERAQAASGKVTRSLGEQAMSDMVATLAARAQAAREAKTLPGQTGLESIISPEVRAVFEKAFYATSRLFERIGIAAPTPEDLAGRGIDFIELARQYQAEKAAGHEPEIILAPYVDLLNWQGLYRNLENNASVNHDGRIKNGGLYVNDDVKQAWSTLAIPEVIPGEEGVMRDKSYTWSLRLIPGTSAPTEVNVDHAKSHAHHPTIPEYLTLQALRLQANEQPIDGATYTWLAGTFNTGARAPHGNWSRDDGRVNVFWDGVGYRFDYLGSRVPVG